MSVVMGGCLCKKQRYAISGEVISQGICYCRLCQKAAGAESNSILVIARSNFEIIKKRLGFYQSQTNRGSFVSRFFCPNCGTHLFADISDVPGLVTVRALTLDRPDFFHPQYLVWTKRALSSTAIPSNVPRYMENAPFSVLVPRDYSY